MRTLPFSVQIRVSQDKGTHTAAEFPPTLVVSVYLSYCNSDEILFIFSFFLIKKRPPANTDSVKSVSTSGLSKYVRIFSNCLNTLSNLGFTITLFQFDQAVRASYIFNFRKNVAPSEHKCQFVSGGDFSMK